MPQDLDAIIRDHHLSPSAARALRELLGHAFSLGSAPTEHHRSGHTTVILDEPGEGDEPVLEPANDRYLFESQLGRGGFAEVWRVHDTVLDRRVAMKIVHGRLMHDPRNLRRFLLEAKATARLQHPHIIPVYDMGHLPDGRTWFTMREVRGETFTTTITSAHNSNGPTVRRLIAILVSIVQAVAHAHANGVVHRDLKPSNLMVGDLGEVYVLDWGIAKVLADASDADTLGSHEKAADARNSTGPNTLQGWVAGTPAFMPPEQARGDRIDERVDVYALGAVLYQVLEGRPPYEGTPLEILADVLAGPPKALWPGHPPELAAVAQRAMARDPAERYRTAAGMLGELQDWLEGAKRKEQAAELARGALLRARSVEALKAEAERLHADGEARLKQVAAWAPESEKAAGWAAHDQAVEVALQAELADLEVEQGLHAALRVAPDLVMAHEALVERSLERHKQAEAQRNTREARKLQYLLRAYAESLPVPHPTRRKVEQYLDGHGALTLITEPIGAEVFVYRYVEQQRRLVEVFHGAIGHTPLYAAPLAVGSYVCVLRHPDRVPMRVPVEIRRMGHWDGRPAGAIDPAPLVLLEHLPDDEVYVPKGWFDAGSADAVVSPRRLWCDAFVIQRAPVTNRQYLAFLDALVAAERTPEALAHAPRERAAVPGEPGPLLLDFDGRQFSLRPDAQGDLWEMDWPVVQVDWHGATAYAQWLAERTGMPWRLPSEFEWEKAARGVDGRLYPWGNRFENAWARIATSLHGHSLPCSIHEYPVDTSPYGVTGMAGNVQDWCLESYDAPLPEPNTVVVPAPGPGTDGMYVARGGAWDTNERTAQTSNRSRAMASYRSWLRGFRLARSTP